MAEVSLVSEGDDSSLLRLSCPRCRTPLTIRSEQAGETYRCPSCQSTLVVPADLNKRPPTDGGYGLSDEADRPPGGSPAADLKFFPVICPL